MSLNQSMNIALGSMQNNQYALTVVSQNIANLNTEGYHRQRVNFSENQYTSDCSGVISTIRGMNGASIDSLTAYIDDGAFKDVINKNSDAEYYNTLNDILGDLEGITDELGENGLSALLGDFYSAASNLEKYPTDMAIRQQFLLAAENVCEKFNYVSDKLDSLEAEKYDDVQMQTTVINSLFEDLAEANKNHILNHQSDSTKVGIDNILAELSDYMNVTTTTNKNGSVNVLVNGVEVVQGTEVKQYLKSSFDSENPDKPLSYYLESNDEAKRKIASVNDSITGGKLRGYNDILNGTNGKVTSFNEIKTAVDKAAAGFAKALNEIQTFEDGDVIAASITSDSEGNMILEQATKVLVNTKDGSSTVKAKNIQINPEMDENPFLIAAARVDKSQYEGDDWQKAIGNSDNAAEFSAMRNAKIMEYDNGVKCTLSEYLVNNAAKTGMDAASADSKAKLYQDMADSAAANYSNLVGVNLDEELADMIRYQRSYEASARVFAAVNNIMDILFNMV